MAGRFWYQTMRRIWRGEKVVESAQRIVEPLPIQEGGRVKPLHTFASFTLLRLSGRRSLEVEDTRHTLL